MAIELKNIGVNRWEVTNYPKMKARAVILAKEEMLTPIKQDRSLEQLAQAACLPQIVSPVWAMPDVHEGYGLPIGGVLATDGLISSGAVGMDINCGVRLLTSRLRLNPRHFSPESLRHLAKKIEAVIPVGVGSTREQPLNFSLQEVVDQGARVVVDQGFGSPEDLAHTEENGCLAGADLQAVSPRAVKRSGNQLGTLGSGNHFIEIQVVGKIFDQDLAQNWELAERQICVMVHTGSRALGHQTCTDYTQRFFEEQGRYGIRTPTRNLASLPADSPTGRQYLAAMAACVNFAFANRQIITYFLRRVFQEIFGNQEGKLTLLYDVAHNIAKWETHHSRKVLIHRKGATRALPPDHQQNPQRYQKTGQPAIVPGSMGTSSYLLVGTPAVSETFCSVNHGAGRAMSRQQARQTINKEEFQQEMGQVIYNQPFKLIVDEAPGAYKNIDLVVDTLVQAGLARPVARLTPLAVIKGS